MESIFKDIQSFVPKNSKLLYIKKKIDIEEDGGNIKWKSLQDIYDKVNRSGGTDKIPYMLVSFINSIFCQERIFFTMDLESFKNKIWNVDQNFKNWKGKDREGFKGTTWTNFKKFLQKEGYVKILNLNEETNRSSDNKALMYELIHPDLLQILNVDKEKQYQETKAWINGDTNAKYDGKHGGKHGGNQAVSNKKEDISDKDIECNTNQNQNEVLSQENNSNFELTMSILFREEFGFDRYSSWADIDDTMLLLASYAVENLGIDNCTSRDFLNYLKELNFNKPFETKKSKSGRSQKNYADDLAKRFEEAVDSYVYQTKKEKNEIQIVKPQEIVKTTVPVVKIDKEERKRIKQQDGQQHTVEVLKAHFAEDSLNALQRQLEKADNDRLKKIIENEIYAIKRVCYGN